MQSRTTHGAERERGEATRARALVRFNGLLFHVLAVGSFLESSAPQHGPRLARRFAAEPEIGLWLGEVWQPQRAAQGARLREYLGATWPEFDWEGAYREFRESGPPHALLPAAPVARPALEALGLCAVAVQAAVVYRALGRSAEEPRLRAIAAQGAREHAEHFGHLRGLYERLGRHGRVGLSAGCRAVTASARAAREHTVAAAFAPLAHHWYGGRPVSDLGYGEFVERLAAFVLRHAPLGRFERWLFRPWFKRGAAAPPLRTGAAAPPLRAAA